MSASPRLDALTERLFATPPWVLTWRGPHAWAYAAAVWEGVQSRWQWPAPAIAVDGDNGYQLWFALAPGCTGDPEALAQAVFARWTPEAPAHQRTRLVQPPVPPYAHANGQWAAFVTPGLAPVFTDSPYLDDAPKPDGQAEVLAPLQLVSVAAWGTAVADGVVDGARDAYFESSAEPHASAQNERRPTAQTHPSSDEARAFLLQVMRDPNVDMVLRVEAAKSLL